MSSWLDKAKEAANIAAEEAKKLAETAKNANYGEMFDKTKQMAMQAADEAKKAAAAVSSAVKKDDKTGEVSGVATAAPVVAAETVKESSSAVDGVKLQECKKKLEQVESLLKEIRSLLR